MDDRVKRWLVNVIEEADNHRCRGDYDGAIRMIQDTFVQAEIERLERCKAEIERLTMWKAEALIVFDEWEEVWEAAGRPGRIGQSKAKAVQEAIVEKGL